MIDNFNGYMLTGDKAESLVCLDLEKAKEIYSSSPEWSRIYRIFTCEFAYTDINRQYNAYVTTQNVKDFAHVQVYPVDGAFNDKKVPSLSHIRNTIARKIAKKSNTK